MSIHCPARVCVIEAYPPIVPLALGRKVEFFGWEGPKLELKRPAWLDDEKTKCEDNKIKNERRPSSPLYRTKHQGRW